MEYFKKRLAAFLVTVFLFAWITYPGFYHKWYYPYPENYAWPAHITNLYDPPWGFWYY